MPDAEDQEKPRIGSRPRREPGSEPENPLDLLVKVALLEELAERCSIDLSVSCSLQTLNDRVGTLTRLALAEDMRIRALENAR